MADDSVQPDILTTHTYIWAGSQVNPLPDYLPDYLAYHENMKSYVLVLFSTGYQSDPQRQGTRFYQSFCFFVQCVHLYLQAVFQLSGPVCKCTWSYTPY